MQQNMGTTDSVIRTIVGVGLLIGAFFARGPWHWLALPGAIMLLTAVVRVCPAYWPFRIHTN